MSSLPADLGQNQSYDQTKSPDSINWDDGTTNYIDLSVRLFELDITKIILFGRFVKNKIKNMIRKVDKYMKRFCEEICQIKGTFLTNSVVSVCQDGE